MLAVNGKSARMLVCQDRECGHKEIIARISNARCPQCHKKMEIIKRAMKNNLYVIHVDIKRRCRHLRQDGKKKVQA